MATPVLRAVGDRLQTNVRGVICCGLRGAFAERSRARTARDTGCGRQVWDLSVGTLRDPLGQKRVRSRFTRRSGPGRVSTGIAAVGVVS